MIKKLRKKLVLASMVSLLVVLLIIEGSIGILNYQKIVADADQVLNILKENSGQFPDMPPHGEPEQKKEMKDAYEKEHLMSPELPYESRYFSVLLNEDGKALSDRKSVV